MGIKMTQKSHVVCDGYVKYEEAEVDRSAIMQNGRQTIILDFISAKYVISYPCVESLDLVSYTWSRYFALADIAEHIKFAKLKVNLMETFS